MKTIYKGLLLTATALAASSCAERDLVAPGAEDGDLMPICLGAEYPSATRASDAGFEDGDRMGVYVLDYSGDTPEDINDKDAHARNVQFRFNGADNTWSGSTTLYWTPDTPADIIGYYPMEAAIDDGTAVVVSVSRRQDLHGDGASMGGYEASDYLWGRAAKVMPTSGRVDLTLGHVMAGVRVTLAEGTGFAAGEWASVSKDVLIPNVTATGTLNLSTGKVSVSDDSPITVTPLEANGDWRGVVVPQKVAAGNSLIDVTVDGVSYSLKKSEVFTYVSGKLHTFTITVNKKADTGKYEFTLSSEAITAWIDDVDFRDGVMREYIVVDVPKRGGLRAAIESAQLNPEDIINLKVTGEMDEFDFEYIRENIRFLSSINLKDATLYEGQDKDCLPGIAFRDMATLTHIIYPKHLVRLGGEAFRWTGLIGSIIIPEGVKEIGWGCYMNTPCMGELSLPSTLEIIGDGAFQYGPNLSGELKLPEHLKAIGGGAFLGCRFTGQLVLPESLEYIGGGAFYSNSFSGDLVIPQSVKTLESGAFQNVPFTGTLTLPEGMTAIDNLTFFGCGFKGELVIPSTVKRLGDNCFSGTKFSKIIFPENLLLIGFACFEGCNRLSGTLEIPKKMTSLNARVFKDCTLLDEVIIGENISKIEGAAFAGCYNLSSVVVNNPEPPLMKQHDMDQYHAMPFEAVPKDNFTIQVPQEAIAAYRQADYWKEFKRFAAYSNFVCRPASACALNTAHQENLVLNSDGDWEVISKPDWCTLSKTSGSGKTQLSLTIKEMARGNGNREGEVVFKLKGTEFTTNCKVSQYDYQYGEDQCVTLQTHKKGNGVDVLFLGDGFDGEAISNGDYLNLVNEQMEAFFGVEPYTTYRDYFNVYACISLSQEAGVNTSHTWRNTRHRSLYAGGMLMPESVDDVFDYAVKYSPLKKERMSRSLIIMTLNSDEYGSASTITWDGSAIAMCCRSTDPYPMDTRGVVQHEACGHAFGKLGEERVTRNAYATQYVKGQIGDMQSRGWYQNLSLNGNLKTVHWSHMVFDPRYSDKVDIFEGGCNFSRDVFRCEINSCMNYGIPYFSAISRQDIVKRILEYAGESFTLEKFYEKDSDAWGSTGATRSAMVPSSKSYINSGLHREPVYIKSKKY